MNITYLVNRVSASQHLAEVDLKGQKVTAQVAVTEVELVDEEGQHGSLTLRFRTPEEVEFAVATFKQGENYVLSL